MNWWDYVTKVGGTNQTAIAQRVGLSGASINRWRSSAPAPENVRAFAKAHGRPVLEAFVAAGYISEEDARATVVRADVGALTDDELIAEIHQRLTAARAPMPLPQREPHTPEVIEAVRQATLDVGDRVKDLASRKGMDKQSRDTIISDVLADHMRFVEGLLKAQSSPDAQDRPDSAADAG